MQDAPSAQMQTCNSSTKGKLKRKCSPVNETVQLLSCSNSNQLLPITGQGKHYEISKSQNEPLFLPVWMQKHGTDPALKVCYL